MKNNLIFQLTTEKVLAVAIFIIIGHTNIAKAQQITPTAKASSYFQIPDSSRQKIEEAAPASSQVKADRPKKILVFNMHRNGLEFRKGHPSVPYTNYAIQHLGSSTGAYEVWFSRDTLVFQKDFLKQFDAICFNNTAGVLFYDPQLRQNLLDYVFEGGGFIGTHAAGATFCQWPKYDFFPDYGMMLGGFESGGHPWKPHEWINLKIDDPIHPVNATFNGKNWDVSDEVFQFTDPYSRNRQRALISIDTSNTNMDMDRRILPERRADGDIAISWVKRYGKGKIFYTSLGHNSHLAWNPKVLKHYLDGFQFALGDLQAPTTPSQKVTPAMLAHEELGWKLGVEAYTFKDNTFFEVIEKTDSLGLAYVGGLNVQNVSKDIPKKLDHNLSIAEIQQIRNKLSSHGLSMLTYFVFDIPGDKKECEKIFEFGKKMGVETFISEPKIEDLDLIEEYCKRYDIKLAIHNHGPRLSPVYMYPEKIVEICKGRSPLIGAACDFGHWAKEGIDPLEAVKTLGDRVITIQMHDQSEINANGHDVPWGTGKVQLEEILQFLKEKNINPVMFGLEYSYNWGKSLPDIVESIQYFNYQTRKLANQKY